MWCYPKSSWCQLNQLDAIQNHCTEPPEFKYAPTEVIGVPLKIKLKPNEPIRCLLG